MKKIILPVTLFVICAFLFPRASRADAPKFTIEFGKEETVFNTATQQCSENDTSDSPAKALVDASGTVQVYSSNSENRRLLGPNLTDLHRDCHTVMSSDPNPNPRSYEGGEWVASPYTIDGVKIWSLLHTEYHGEKYGNCSAPNPSRNCWWNSINLAISTDMGQTFTHALSPNQNIANTSVNFKPDNTLNIGFFHPSGIVQKNGYYYATVYHQIPPDYYTCTMRTNNLDNPSSWRFWNGSGFSLPTQGVSATNDCAKTADGNFNLQYNTYLNYYTDVTSHNDDTIQIGLQTSSDMTTWNPLQWFAKPNPAHETLNNYTTLIQPGAETRNFEDIGRSPWLYYAAPSSNPTEAARGINNLKRVRIRFSKPEDVGKYDVLDLHFNEYKGTKTLDSSFYGNDGTLSGGATFRQEGDTKFIHLDATGTVTAGNDASLNRSGDITITGRVRTTQSPSGFAPIVVKQGAGIRNYGLYLSQEGKLHFSVMNGAQFAGSLSNRSVNDGAWHDIQVNFSDSTGKTQFVVDGVLDKTVNHGGKLADGVNTGPVTIGNGLLVADLDHLTIYNYLLPVPASTSPSPSPKLGDLNNSGTVDQDDYSLFIPEFGKSGAIGFSAADINKDGKVDIFDYNVLVGNIGK